MEEQTNLDEAIILYGHKAIAHYKNRS